MKELQKSEMRISVCGKSEIDKFATSNVSHIISIDNPGSPTNTPEWFRGIHWHVVFQDVESANEAKEFNAVAPTIQDVKQIIEFGEICLKTSKTQKVHLLVHCMAGASRSTAAAFAILCLINGKGSEPSCLKHLLAIRPDAFPNKLVVKYADQLLSRNGKMLEALRPLREEFTQAVDSWAESMRKKREGPNQISERTS